MYSENNKNEGYCIQWIKTIKQRSVMFRKEKINKAFKMSIPIAFGYISLGFMGGAMIQKSGFNLIEILLMSCHKNGN